MKIIQKLAFLILIGISTKTFAQSEYVAKFTFNKSPKVKLENCKYFDSKIVFEQSGENLKIGEIQATGKSSKTGGAEYILKDRKDYVTNDGLSINGLQKGTGDLEIIVKLGLWNWKERKQSDKPYTKTAEGRFLYNWNYKYGLDENLIVKFKGKTIIEESLGKITDQKQYSYSEENKTFYPSKEVLISDYETKQLFSKVRNILAENFENQQIVVGFEAEEFKSKDPKELNEVTAKLISLIQQKDIKEVNIPEIQNIISTYEKFLEQASESKKDAINPKVATKIRYNLALAYFINGNPKKSKYYLSIDDNLKQKSGLFSSFSSKFDFIKSEFNNDGSLQSIFNSSRKRLILIESPYDLNQFISNYENIFNK